MQLTRESLWIAWVLPNHEGGEPRTSSKCFQLFLKGLRAQVTDVGKAVGMIDFAQAPSNPDEPESQT